MAILWWKIYTEIVISHILAIYERQEPFQFQNNHLKPNERD